MATQILFVPHIRTFILGSSCAVFLYKRIPAIPTNAPSTLSYTVLHCAKMFSPILRVHLGVGLVSIPQ